MKKITVVISNPTEPIGLGMPAFGGVVSAAYDVDLGEQQPPKPVRLSQQEVNDAHAVAGVFPTESSERLTKALQDAMGAKDAGPLVEALEEITGTFEMYVAYIDVPATSVVGKNIATARAALAKHRGAA